MITQKEYDKLLKYSLKFVKNFNKNDAEDIAQTACLLLLSHPTQTLTNALLYKAAKSASFRMYFKKLSTGERIDRDHMLDDVPDADAQAEGDLTAQVEARDILEKVQNTEIANYRNKKNKIMLTKNEKMLLLKVIEGYDPEIKDRTHFSNLRKKIRVLYDV